MVNNCVFSDTGVVFEAAETIGPDRLKEGQIARRVHVDVGCMAA